ncbi:circularly permuted type 2 ATP-grasp protein, partial [Streptomyces klenkii]
MADVFDSYALADAWDEMFERPGVVRAAYEPVFAALQPLDASDLAFRAEQMARSFTDRGVTYAHAGEERPFPLDLVPRILDAAEWDTLTRGVRQRVRALEAYLGDAYGRCQVFEDGVVPYRLLHSSPHYHRAAHGVEPPNGVRIHVAGVDLVRDVDGGFRVLEDNVRIPSGVSYVIENRRAMTRVFPSLFAEAPVRPVDEYPQRLLAALRAAAPEGTDDPVVVVLSPGVHNAAYFEHALLARLMGVQLVEGRDLVCSGTRVRMRTTRGEVPVHVVYRRIDDEFLDPLHFRPDSVIGCPGIMTAARAGHVTLANAVGNGIADDKLLYTYVPDLIRYYLGEEPLLPNVETYRLEDPGQLEAVLDQLDRLVIKPVDGA